MCYECVEARVVMRVEEKVGHDGSPDLLVLSFSFALFLISDLT